MGRKVLEVLLVAIKSVQIALLLENLRHTTELVTDTGQSQPKSDYFYAKNKRK